MAAEYLEISTTGGETKRFNAWNQKAEKYMASKKMPADKFYKIFNQETKRLARKGLSAKEKAAMAYFDKFGTAGE